MLCGGLSSEEPQGAGWVQTGVSECWAARHVPLLVTRTWHRRDGYVKPLSWVTAGFFGHMRLGGW